MTFTFKVVDGDIPFSGATGRPLELEERDKFTQDVRENLDTEVQRDGTGADLEGVIAEVGDVFSLRAEIAKRITESFTFYQVVQDTVQRFDRSAQERFARIAQVQVWPVRSPGSGEVDKTTYAYRVDVLSLRGVKAVTVTGVIVR